MKKTVLSVLLPVIVLAVGSSCAAVQKTESVPKVSLEQQNVSIGNAMLGAFRTNDYSGFSTHLPENLKQEFSEEKFNSGRKQVIDSAGNLQGVRYLGKLAGPVFENYLWAVKFLRRSGNDTVEQELLFKLTSASSENKPHVLSFGFML